MFITTHQVDVATDTNGDATAYTPPVRGRILQIRYVKTDFAAGVDFDVTLEDSGIVVWDEDDVNASKTVLPRQAVQDTAGADATLDGTRKMREPIYCGDERVKIVVGSGGNTKSGTFHVTVG